MDNRICFFFQLNSRFGKVFSGMFFRMMLMILSGLFFLPLLMAQDHKVTQVIFKIEGVVENKVVIDTPNRMPDSNTQSFWVQADKPMMLPPLPGSSFLLPPLDPDLFVNTIPSLTEGTKKPDADNEKIAKMDDIAGANPSVTIPAGSQPIQPGSPPISLVGAGSGSTTASADGTVDLRIEMHQDEPQCDAPGAPPTVMEIHLFNADGTEVLYNGKPLVIWSRQGSVEYHPAYFQGNEDSNSMIVDRVGGNGKKDWGANRNGVTYQIPLKAGQRIEYVVSGNPEASETIKLEMK